MRVYNTKKKFNLYKKLLKNLKQMYLLFYTKVQFKIFIFKCSVLLLIVFKINYLIFYDWSAQNTFQNC